MESGREKKWKRGGIWRQEKRNGWKPVLRGNFVFVSGVWAHKQKSQVAFCFRCAPLCCERYQPALGQSTAAFCSLCKEISQIPEMNTCAEDELCSWLKTHNQTTHRNTHWEDRTQSVWAVEHIFCWAGTVWHLSEIIFLVLFAIHVDKYDCVQKWAEIWRERTAAQEMSSVLFVSTSFHTVLLVPTRLSSLVAAENYTERKERDSFWDFCCERKMNGWKSSWTFFPMLEFFYSLFVHTASNWNKVLLQALCLVLSFIVIVSMAFVLNTQSPQPHAEQHFRSLLVDRHVGAHYVPNASYLCVFLSHFLFLWGKVLGTNRFSCWNACTRKCLQCVCIFHFYLIK